MGLSKEFIRIKLRTGHGFYCPNGHALVYKTNDQDTTVSAEDTIRVLPPFEDFLEDTCNSCALTYLLEKNFKARRKSDSLHFWCPNGHSQNFLPPAPPPKTVADIDYEKMMAYHAALGEIALLKPEMWKNKKLLKRAILIARNAIELQKIKDELKK
jgi:hypothetical protein